MLNRALKKQLQATQESAEQAQAVVDALKSHMAYIEFSPDGTVLDANELLLNTTGTP